MPQPPPPPAAVQSMHSHNNSQPLALRPPPSANAATALPSAAVVAAPPPLSSAQPPLSVAAPAKAVPVVLLPSKDGLPLLPSHAQSCGVDPPRALRPFEYGYPQQQRTIGVVDVFGDVSTREAIRAKLLRFYEETKQVAITRTNDEDGDKKKSVSTVAAENLVNGGVSEMTLRIDTELELLRQQCFAERNAQWNYHTPEMFSYEPAHEPVWNPLIVGNTKIALRRLKHDARATTTERDEKEGAAATANGVSSLSTSATMKRDGKGFPLGQFSRDRPWPPREFMQKATTRPSRARGGKRKAPAPVIEERSIFSKLCVECHTQSTPLWRRITRESTSLKDTAIVNGAPAVKSEKVPTPVTNGALANSSASMATETQEGQPQDQQLPAAVAVDNAVDVCLECYLKLQRSDIFARKATERAQQQREKQERAAAEALVEKKRLKQQLQLFKKQQQAKNSKKRKPSAQHQQYEPVVEMQQQPVAPIEASVTTDTDTSTTTAAAPSIKIVIKTDVGLENTEVHDERLDHVSRPKSAKRDKKKSKKSKKDKKKKKKKQHNSDNEDDDLEESDSGTPLPSPPQMVGQYEYADLGGGNGGKGGMRSSRSASSVTSFDAVVENHSVVYEDEPVQVQQTTTAIADTQSHQELAMAEETVTSSSKRTRKSTSRTEISTTTVTTTTAATVAATTPSSASKSRKRKNLVVVAAPTSIPEAAIEAPLPPSSRPSRSKASSAVVAVAPAPAPVVAVVAPAPPISARKRARTKKESARERELRALGQYCPVCNAVYEEDDESSFVCCDSCEMWVHAACDTTLTPALLAALADTNEKYICPLCAGR